MLSSSLKGASTAPQPSAPGQPGRGATQDHTQTRLFPAQPWITRPKHSRGRAGFTHRRSGSLASGGGCCLGRSPSRVRCRIPCLACRDRLASAARGSGDVFPSGAPGGTPAGSHRSTHAVSSAVLDLGLGLGLNTGPRPGKGMHPRGAAQRPRGGPSTAQLHGLFTTGVMGAVVGAMTSSRPFCPMER